MIIQVIKSGFRTYKCPGMVTPIQYRTGSQTRPGRASERNLSGVRSFFWSSFSMHTLHYICGSFLRSQKIIRHLWTTRPGYNAYQHTLYHLLIFQGPGILLGEPFSLLLNNYYEALDESFWVYPRITEFSMTIFFHPAARTLARCPYAPRKPVLFGLGCLVKNLAWVTIFNELNPVNSG